MDKKFSNMLQRSAKGSFILFIGQMGSTLIAALGQILVARILGSTNLGFLSVALIPLNICLIFINNGISSALINYIAENRYNEQYSKLKSIIVAGFTINFSIGLVLSSLLFLFAGRISNQIFMIEELEELLRILSLSLVSQALLNTSYAVYVGFENMKTRSILQILFSVLKTIIGPILVFLGYGVLGAAYGYSFPVLISGLIAIILVVRYTRDYSLESSESLCSNILLLLRYAYPLFFSNILSGGLSQIFYFMLPFYASISDIGNLHAANNFHAIIGFFTIPLSIATFPLLSKLKPKDEVFDFVFSNIVKYKSMLVYPLSFMVIGFSNEIISFLYGKSYPLAPLYLRVLMINYFFTGIGSGVISDLLNSQKETKISFRRTLMYVLIASPLGMFLIPRMGVIGLQITQIIAPKIGLVYGLWWIGKEYHLTINYRSLFKIFSSSIISYVLSRYVVDLFVWPLIIELFVGCGVFMFVYLVSILLTGALSKKNIEDIRSLVITYGRIGLIVDKVLQLFTIIARDI